MFDIKSFGIIGGDKRQLYCARSIAEDGYSVSVCGFDKCGTLHGIENTELHSLLSSCDAFVLPLPCSRDGVTVNAPLSTETITLGSDELELIGSKPVFAGMKDRLPLNGCRVFDYSTREEFAVENAVPTSEGAIEIAMHEYEGTIHSSSCLVTGYGRIGRVLASMLSGLGASVTVSARSCRDLAFIRASGFKAIRSDSLSGTYDIIFNTVPFVLFDACTLAKTASGALLIDLASMPGGVDTEAAKRLSIRTIHALSLPGKAAPKSSGAIIKNAVFNRHFS